MGFFSSREEIFENYYNNGLKAYNDGRYAYAQELFIQARNFADDKEKREDVDYYIDICGDEIYGQKNAEAIELLEKGRRCLENWSYSEALYYLQSARTLAHDDDLLEEIGGYIEQCEEGLRS